MRQSMWAAPNWPPWRRLVGLLGLLLASEASSQSGSNSIGCDRFANHQETAEHTGAGAAIWQQARAAAVPAMGLLLFHNGQLQSGLACGAGFTRNTPMRYGSITKTFTALTLLTLNRDGLLAMQQPVASLLSPPPFDNPWAKSHPLTVRQLLELSAGLPDLSAREWQSSQALTLTQALALDPGNRRLLWPAGLQHSYSNSVVGISTAVIEKLSGRSLTTTMAARVFKPLQMHNATLLPVAALPGGFRADGQTPITYWHMTYPAFGALNASLADMSRALGWLIRQGQHWHLERTASSSLPPAPENALNFSAADRRALFEPSSTVAAAAGLRIGYAAGIYGRVRHGTLFLGHGGDADGYRARYGFDPSTGHGYLLVINTDNPQLLRALVDRAEQHLATPRPGPPLATGRDLAQYAGRYYPSSARFGSDRWRTGQAPTITVTTHANRLQVRRKAGTIELLPVAFGRQGALFRRAAEPLATVALVPTNLPGSNQPVLLLQGELGNYLRVAPGPCAPIFPFCDSQ